MNRRQIELEGLGFVKKQVKLVGLLSFLIDFSALYRIFDRNDLLMMILLLFNSMLTLTELWPYNFLFMWL
jgi:hypothetical protein